MKHRLLALGLCLAALIPQHPPAVRACPYCRADAVGLSALERPPADDAGSLPVMLSGGLDFASAFYFRGYLQADHGPIVQPYLNLFTAHPLNEELVIRPYVSLFHSAHFAENNRMADMSDVMAGSVISSRDWSIDTRYAYYTMSPLMRTPVHELGAKASWNLLSLWDDAGDRQPIGVRPFAGVFGDYITDQQQVQLYANLGIEPSWRFDLAGTKVGLGLPIEWGLGGNRYYFNSDGSNAAYGYFSSTLTASVALPALTNRGQWFLNASVQYLHLAADSVQAAGDGRNDVGIGKIGLSFVY